MQRPLEGVRIVAVEQYGAGPHGTMQLADLGAEVIKVENASDGGDVGRHVRHPNETLPRGDSLFFQSFNRNKRSIKLNLKTAGGQEILRKLAAGADGVFNNLRGDLPGKLGLTYEDLKAINPRIVCVHLSAYGRDNDRAAWPGYDYLMQAECGHLSVTGEKGGPPSRMGLSIVDLSTGVQAALALASGILGARASGQGGDYDVSLYDTAMTNLCYVSAWHMTLGETVGREKRSAHPNLVPSQLYKTQDGWIFLMCNKEKFWPILCEKIGRPEWGNDPRFKDFQARLANRDLITDLLDQALSEKTTDAWMALFQGEVPGAPVYDVGQALDSPFTQSTGQIIDLKTPSGMPVQTIGPAIRQPNIQPRAEAAPEMAADQHDILTGLGYTAVDIAAMEAAGAL
jgi:crotonobetainyl-CoA:carnitine CoA-transferase CaiB-like acyl-CoA transferase